MPLGMEVGLHPGDFVLDGEPAPLPKKEAEPPQFWAHVYCGQTAEWIKMALGIEVGLSPGDFVVHVYCGQTVAWIKMPVGTEIGLGLRDIVLDGAQLPLP